MHGRLSGIAAGGEVSWKNPQIEEVMQFNVSALARIGLDPDPSASLKTPPNAIVHLSNQDELPGELVLLDNEKLVLDTWYAGRLSIPRKRIRMIRPAGGNQNLYEGPHGLDGWTLSDARQEPETGPAWGYRNGVFFSKHAGAIARDVKLPDKAAIDLDVAWRDYLQFTVTIYTDSLEVYHLARPVIAGGIVVNAAAEPETQQGAGFYAMQFNYNTVYLLTVREDGSVQNSPTAQIPGLENKRQAKISIRVSKPQKVIHLFVDGMPATTWREPEEFAGRGTGIRLVQQGQSLINVANIQIAEWDGSLPAATTAASTNASTDLMLLKNQDNLSGALEGIKDGAVSFSSSFGTLDIPLERVSEITLATNRVEATAAEPGSVRAYFAERGSVTFRLERWAEKVEGVSPNFGRAEFKPDVFSLLDFQWKP